MDSKSKLSWWLIGVATLVLAFFMWQTFQAVQPNLSYSSEGKFGVQLGFLEDNPWAYLILMGLSVLFPFLLSFDKKVAYYKNWRFFFPAALLTGAFFYPLDIYFTQIGVWGFNPRYANGFFLGLPAGEWLFFIVVPYCCVFIYECLNAYITKDILRKATPYLDAIFLIILTVVGCVFINKAYTGSKFLMPAVLLALNIFVFKTTWRSRFYLAFFLQVIPFILVDGVLTGGFTAEPTVVYTNSENLTPVIGRLVSVPYDDLAYDFLLLLMVTNWYEWWRSKQAAKV